MKKLLALVLLLGLSASAQNSHYPPQTGGGGGVTSLNSLTGDLNLLAGTGISITPSGSNITIANTGSTPIGTANTNAIFGSTGGLTTTTTSPVTFQNNSSDFSSLIGASSLTNTSIGPNTPTILFDGTTAGALDAGAVALTLNANDSQAELYLSSVDQAGSDTSAGINVGSGYNTGTGNTGQVFIGSGASTGASGNTGDMTFFSGNSAHGNSGNLQLFSGQASNGTGGNLTLNVPSSNVGGNIILNIEAGSGTQGNIQFLNGSQGTAGYVWTSTDTLGSGSWMPSGGGGATTALNNLVSTAVNAAINPGVANTISQGTTALPFLNIEANSFTLGDGTNDLFSISQVTSSNIEFQGAPSTNTITTSFEGGTNSGSGAGGSLSFGAQSASATGGNGGDLIMGGSDAANPASSGGSVVALISSPSGGGPSGEVGLSGHISYDPGGTYGFSAPSAVTPQTGLGSGATASVSTNSQDMGGVLTFTSGTTGLAAGAEVVVTFGTPYNSGETPVVQLTPSDAAGAIAYYVTSTATDFTVHFVAAPILSTTYSYNYAVVGLL